MRRIKLLHLITHLGVGGALDNTLLTVERLCRQRYEVHLAAGSLEPAYSSWEERGRRCADEVFIFPELQRRVRPWIDARVCRKLASFMQEQEYDIVHTHCAKAGVVGRIAARRSNTQVVVHTFHAFGNQVTRASKKSVPHKLANVLKKQLFNVAERYTSKISDRVIAVCEQNRQMAIDQQLASPKKITTIYSGIDTARFIASGNRTQVLETIGLEPSRPIVGFIGRLAEQKAPLDFIAAAKMVLASRADVQFVIAGDGPLTNQVKRAVEHEPRIKWIGFYEQVPELMAILDVVAVSSLWEGLGRSVTEAMIMKVPVAATAVDGIPELVKHGQTGLLSPPGQASALAENILELLRDPKRAQAMADAARDFIDFRFDADTMVKKIDQLYQELLQAKKTDLADVVPRLT
ncbi:MAG: glycosyltransferase family 4 protein [Pirellulaceae bacterium]|nr:glycosyltransferase family 4 protein [Pirellulaceae bacterium]